jgi:hypothetical protein
MILNIVVEQKSTDKNKLQIQYCFVTTDTQAQGTKTQQGGGFYNKP